MKFYGGINFGYICFPFFCVCVHDNLRAAYRIPFKFTDKVHGGNSLDAFEDGHHWAMCQLTVGKKPTFFTKNPFIECIHIFTPVNPPTNDID